MPTSDCTAQCVACHLDFPNTDQYFVVDKRGRLRRRCKRCFDNYVKAQSQVVPDGYQACCKCFSVLPSTSEYFFADATRANGLNPKCKTCDYEYTKKWRRENPDKQLEKSRRERANMTPEQIEHKRAYARAYSREYHWSNRDHVLAKMHEYYVCNLDYHRQRKRIYRRNNPEKSRQADRRRTASGSRKAMSHRRQARKHGLPDTFTAQDWQYALNYFNGCCAACGNPPGLWSRIAADHWIPLANPNCPGTVPMNIIPLCHALKDGANCCNNIKHHRDPIEFLETTFGKRRAREILRRIQAYFDSLK